MITVFAAKSPMEGCRGFITITTDRDGLPPDATQTNTIKFDSYGDILASAEMYHRRGYSVDVHVKGYPDCQYEQ